MGEIVIPRRKKKEKKKKEEYLSKSFVVRDITLKDLLKNSIISGHYFQTIFFTNILSIKDSVSII